MALGRIVRSKSKIKARERRDLARGYPGRGVKAKIYINRKGSGYEAQACLGPVAALRTAHKSCGRKQIGRTPQSVIAKALKALGAHVAKRGRR